MTSATTCSSDQDSWNDTEKEREERSYLCRLDVPNLSLLTALPSSFLVCRGRGGGGGGRRNGTLLELLS